MIQIFFHSLFIYFVYRHYHLNTKDNFFYIIVLIFRVERERYEKGAIVKRKQKRKRERLQKGSESEKGAIK